MILQFKVQNYKSFKEEAVLTMLASNYDKKVNEGTNVYKNDRFRLRVLKSAVIYGANASGKTKLIEAFDFMRHLVISSSTDFQLGDEINVTPFKLSTETENEPSEFEVIFLYKEEIYRYGFAVSCEEIVAEWLYKKASAKESEIFYRDKTETLVNRNFTKGRMIVKEGLVRNNALLLSVAAQFNDETAGNVTNWFRSLKTLNSLNEYSYNRFTLDRTEDRVFKTKIMDILKAADLGINDVFTEKNNIINTADNTQVEDKGAEYKNVLAGHYKYGKNKEIVSTVNLSFDEDESSGTRKFFALSGLIIDILEKGTVLVVDELDAKLHPNIVSKIVEMFNSSYFNPKNAQLIFNTQNTNILKENTFRRDQIWFIDKNRYGESRLYSLADFKLTKVSKYDRFEENYLRGKYGGTPFLDTFKRLNLAGNEDER